MLFISGLNLDSAFNLACEEYLLHEFEEEIFILWQNDKSIVIGKHQKCTGRNQFALHPKK